MKPLFAYYLLGINIITILAYGWDKSRAERAKRRIPEARLLLFAFLGGFPGAWAAMSLFRHKTQKTSFKIKLTLVTLLNPLWPALYFLLRKY